MFAEVKIIYILEHEIDSLLGIIQSKLHTQERLFATCLKKVVKAILMYIIYSVHPWINKSLKEEIEVQMLIQSICSTISTRFGLSVVCEYNHVLYHKTFRIHMHQ